MSGKPKTIPRPSQEGSKVSDSQQMPMSHDQNRAYKSVGQMHEASMSGSSDAPTDENFVNDDIIEENSHVIPPTKKIAGKHAVKGKSARR